MKEEEKIIKEEYVFNKIITSGSKKSYISSIRKGDIVPIEAKVDMKTLPLFSNDNITVKLKEQIKEEFGYTAISRLSDGIAIVKLDDKWFHVGLDYRPLYEERYDRVFSFVNDIAIVKLDSKWFHINKDYKPLYEERFDSISNFIDGITRVKLNDRYFYITKNGKEILPVEIIEKIGSRDDNLNIFKIDEVYIFNTGCFFGNLESFRVNVRIHTV